MRTSRYLCLVFLNLALEYESMRPTHHSRLEAAETEIERVAFHLLQRERHGARIPIRREQVDDRAAGIAEPQQLGYLVESLTRRIIARLSQQTIRKTFADLE